MDPAIELFDHLVSGGIRYLRPDVFPRAGIYSSAPDWATKRIEANTILLSEYIVLVPLQNVRYLTFQEQRIFNKALRRSVKVIRTSTVQSRDGRAL
jgi:hypothetical protein